MLFPVGAIVGVAIGGCVFSCIAMSCLNLFFYKFNTVGHPHGLLPDTPNTLGCFLIVLATIVGSLLLSLPLVLLNPGFPPAGNNGTVPDVVPVGMDTTALSGNAILGITWAVWVVFLLVALGVFKTVEMLKERMGSFPIYRAWDST